METNIELAAGQSFVIGGLVDDRLEYTMTKVPGLASIPVLGALFKSRSENKGKTELVVMVTPEVVDPLNPSDPKPVPSMPREFIGPLSEAERKTPIRKAKSRDTLEPKIETAAAKPVEAEPLAVTSEPAPAFEVALAASPEAVAPVPPAAGPETEATRIEAAEPEQTQPEEKQKAVSGAAPADDGDEAQQATAVVEADPPAGQSGSGETQQREAPATPELPAAGSASGSGGSPRE